jgi:hypothetical protein
VKEWIAACALALVTHSATASAVVPAEFGIGPWRIGMTSAQVRSFPDFGPYRSDPENGGIETANGLFGGKRSTFSFAFDKGALSTIQVWNYEGSDPAAAKEAILDVYRLFVQRFGGATVDGVDVDGKAELSEGALRAVLDSTIDGTIKAAADMRKQHPGTMVAATFDMRPVKQPAGSRFQLRWRYTSKYNSLYVVLYQDRANAPLRKMESAFEVSAE